jgi:hypothetical protein
MITTIVALLSQKMPTRSHQRAEPTARRKGPIRSRVTLRVSGLVEREHTLKYRSLVLLKMRGLAQMRERAPGLVSGLVL